MSSTNTAAHQAALALLRRSFGDNDTALLLGGILPITKHALWKDSLARSISRSPKLRPPRRHWKNESLKCLRTEEQASSLTTHDRTLQDSLCIAHDEIARLTHTLESETRSASRLKSIKLDVAKFDGGKSHKLLSWLLQVSTSADAQRIHDATRVVFAMSHMKGRAEVGVFQTLDGPHCFLSFAVFESELKQGKPSLQEFIHDLRFLAANIDDEESLPEPLRVTVSMDGLNQGPARTQLFRAYPDTFE
ncbi:hypothetical protein H257_10971 [Aphanomyces astaci]|uniref:Uncharacterized protein n=1 Tax=Aphanomyces astaci TaxID=112090 RepID=W4G3W3_APHAT|nr:hypothetical protein H257_10971 [Aphanomyces astaci]ETV74380.1 hypothetical protein H257_10971 [Aphanomyces astaci]|eukprot:XP_009836038.1 hypothetical protein H257_10971 [Aphanomyces astaci]